MTADRIDPSRSGPGEVRLTVVCPTYNQEKYIQRALDGFVSQKTNFRFRVLVGDDASTDKTPAIIKDYAIKHPEIIKPVLRERNLGAANNYQDLIKNIDTEYMAFCEGDDYWTDPEKLQKQVDILDRNMNLAICFHPVLVQYEDDDIPDDLNPSKDKCSIFAPHPQASPYDRPTQTIYDIALHSCIPSCSVVYRWRFRRGRDLEYYPADVNPGDVLNNLLHAETGDAFFLDEVMGCYFRPKNSLWGQKNLLANHALEIVRFHELAEKHFQEDVVRCLQLERDPALFEMMKDLLRTDQIAVLLDIFVKHRRFYDLGMSRLKAVLETAPANEAAARSAEAAAQSAGVAAQSAEAEALALRKQNSVLLEKMVRRQRRLGYAAGALVLSLLGNILLLIIKL